MSAMIITPATKIPSKRGPSEWFTGSAWMEDLIDAPAPARLRGAWVTFDPGARTAWHTHPLGQTLFVTSGVGRIQVWGEELKEIVPGDTVWIGAGIKHWHGACPTRTMTHFALQEHLDGTHIIWHERVSDEQYLRPGEY